MGSAGAAPRRLRRGVKPLRGGRLPPQKAKLLANRRLKRARLLLKLRQWRQQKIPRRLKQLKKLRLRRKHQRRVQQRPHARAMKAMRPRRKKRSRSQERSA